MGNQVLKGWNRACTNVGSSVGSLPDYITSQSLTEAEKREQKKLDAEEKMVRQTIEYLYVVMKSDTQELAGIEDKTSTEYAEIAKRLSGNRWCENVGDRRGRTAGKSGAPVAGAHSRQTKAVTTLVRQRCL